MSDITKYRLRAMFVTQTLLLTFLQAQSVITTIAGTNTAGYNGDNIIATTAELHYPYSISFDLNNNLFIADAFNNRIRKINTSGIITTIAGTGTAGYSGDGGG